ncbi:MAG: pilus assembly protein PilP [Desulfobacterales bacterium]
MRSIQFRFFTILLGVALLTAMVGCGQQNNASGENIVKRAIPSNPASARQHAPAKEDPSPADAGQTPQMQAASIRPPYNAEGKLDPFEPLFRQEAPADEGEIKPEVANRPERPRTPLEKLELGQLKLVAVVFAGPQRRALVEEASGKGYVVEMGTSIGRERGKVVEIEKDRIVIKQEFEDDFGDMVVKQKEMKLQKPPGE